MLLTTDNTLTCLSCTLRFSPMRGVKVSDGPRPRFALEKEMSRVVLLVQDTKMVPVALCQGKSKWHVWNLAWREEMVVTMRPQSTAHDGGV